MTSVHHDVVLKCVVLIAFACELMTSVHHDHVWFYNVWFE